MKAGFTISYGLPHAGVIGTISARRAGPVVENQPTTELVISGDVPAQLVNEGVFYVANALAGTAFAQAPVRSVRVEEGHPVLCFEDRERRNGTAFAAGQALTVLRPFSFGNLRDSDPETAIFSFADKSYGTRAGKPYPLWNWCLLVSGFPIDEPAK